MDLLSDLPDSFTAACDYMRIKLFSCSLSMFYALDVPLHVSITANNLFRRLSRVICFMWVARLEKLREKPIAVAFGSGCLPYIAMQYPNWMISFDFESITLVSTNNKIIDQNAIDSLIPKAQYTALLSIPTIWIDTPPSICSRWK